MKKILIFMLVLASILLISCGQNKDEKEEHTHEWKEATCTTAKTCTICNETDGKELGHSWKLKEEVEAKCNTQGYKLFECERCGETEKRDLVSKTEHKWEEATCTKAKKCSACGLTSGTPLGHDTENASCTEETECSRCGEKIPALGHDWVNATCEKPKTCSRCNVTEGGTVDHAPSEPKRENEVKPDCTNEGKYDEVVRCIYCQKEISRETKTEPALGHQVNGEKCSRCGAEIPAIEVINEYFYVDVLGFPHYYLILKNDANYNTEIKIIGDAKDKSGNILESDEDYVEVLGPGETTISELFFWESKNAQSVSYDIEYEKESYYKPIIKNLSYEKHINDKNVTVSVKNNGEYDGKFIEVYALFFNKAGKIIGKSSDYVTGGDLKIGKESTVQLDLFKGYDHVDIYLIGRSGGIDFGDKEVSGVTASDFTIKEYLLEDYFSTSDYLVITNNSSETVSITANGTAKDASGKILGADDLSVSVLAPGETTIESFYFMDVKGVKKVDYTLTFEETNYYYPVIKDLKIESTKTGNGVKVKITNNGDKAAQFVEAHALFFKNNKLVDVSSEYLTDDDSEIKVGKSITETVETYDSFDRVEVYLTGRATKY